MGLCGVVAASWVASDVLERIPHVQDSVSYLFQAETMALGRLSVPMPAVPEAFEHEFILMRDGAWYGKYPPGHPVFLALGVLAGFPWMVSPIAAGLTLVLLYFLGRKLFGSGTALLATLLLLISPFFLFMFRLDDVPPDQSASGNRGNASSHQVGTLVERLGSNPGRGLLWLVDSEPTANGRRDDGACSALAGRAAAPGAAIARAMFSVRTRLHLAYSGAPGLQPNTDR